MNHWQALHGLDAARSVDTLRMPPGNRLEALKGDRAGSSSVRINEIIRGKRGVTADTAWRLGDWLGTGPDVWMNLQSKWDLWHARKARKTA